MNDGGDGGNGGDGGDGGNGGDGGDDIKAICVVPACVKKNSSMSEPRRIFDLSSLYQVLKCSNQGHMFVFILKKYPIRHKKSWWRQYVI